MHIALHGNEFGLIVLVDDRWRAGRLRFVPLTIYFGKRMNVVRGLVVVDHFELLIHLKSEDVWDVLAAFLVERRRFARRSIVGSPGRDIDDDIFQAVARANDDRFRHDRSGVLLGATWLLGHVDRFGLCWRAFVGDFPTDGSTAGPRLQ